MTEIIEEKLDTKAPDLSKDDHALAVGTLFMGYGDIKVVIDRALDNAGKEQLIDSLNETVKEVPATTRIESYQGQFGENNPFEEFFCLAALALQVGSNKWCSTKAAREAKAALGNDTELREYLKRELPNLPEQVRSKVSESLETCVTLA